MKKYRLKKDLPTIKAGATFKLDDNRGLVLLGGDRDTYGPFIPNVFVLYDKAVLDICPNILTEWFEKIPEETKTVWDLEDGDQCWYIDMESLDEVRKIIWGEVPDLCVCCRTYGELFLSVQEAKQELARRKAKQVLLRDTKGFKPDWSDSGQNKTLIYYDSGDKKMKVIPWSVNAMGGIYFANQADAEASIKAHPEEWKTYLGVEEKKCSTH